MSDKQFILMLSALVGLLGGLAAVGIKVGIHYIHGQIADAIHQSGFGFWYLILPVTGIVLSVVLIRYFYRGIFAHGITNVLYAISKHKSIVKIKDAIYFMIGSIFTVGLGGSVGMEATLVMTGSGIGSNTARVFRLSFSHRILLLGCGAASALACFFHAPIAGVVFALEVLLLDLTMSSLVPLLLASVIGAIIGRIFLGEDIILDFSSHSAFSVEQVPFYIVLGLVSGLVAIYFGRVDRLTSQIGERMGRNWKRSLLLGSLAAILIFSFPPLFGEGYGTLEDLFYGKTESLMDKSLFTWFGDWNPDILWFLLAIVLFKAFAVAFTLGAGGIGGYFAPSLFLGGVTGFLVARTVNTLNIFTSHMPEDNFTLVGMAGAMSGIFYAPLSAVFLIAEITSGYDLIVPLMVVSTLSYLLVNYVEPHSLFTRRLAKRGELISHDKEQSVLAMLSMEEIIENDFQPIQAHATLREFLRDAVGESKRNIFPVVDEDNKLVSIVLLDDVRPLLFKQEQYDNLHVQELMRTPPARVYLSDSMREILKKFDQTSAWNLPVVDKDEKYIGFISKSKLLTAYRKTLMALSFD